MKKSKLDKRFNESEKELLKMQFVSDCIYQAVVQDLLVDFCKEYKLNDDELEEISDIARDDLYRKIKKLEYEILAEKEEKMKKYSEISADVKLSYADIDLLISALEKLDSKESKDLLIYLKSIITKMSDEIE